MAANKEFITIAPYPSVLPVRFTPHDSIILNGKLGRIWTAYSKQDSAWVYRGNAFLSLRATKKEIAETFKDVLH